ncbi:MAG TPA: folylpolyglutamate synthase/dihydrofolate synthase family protein [Chitinophagales bacterium]|nr:folylpolyglutamate synthase/dihydrofolate synthase family protein [Chitinophagales bacterium]
MNYEETIAFLYTQLPMYSRIGKAAYKSDLTNTIQLCKLLHHPEQAFQSIHIAGTNGKGSVSHMLAAVLQLNGYKTGLYTSPHLKDFRERIRIDGAMIPREFVVEFVQDHREAVTVIGCSFFEWTVGLAFDYFRKEKVDIAVIETGLGGRLDSTNVITPLLSVITNVSYDHTDLLGDTLEKIAFEKAGIIKPSVPVVIGERSSETDRVFSSAALSKNADLNFASDYWGVTDATFQQDFLALSIKNKANEIWKVNLDLTGEYQQKNILTVLESTRALGSIGFKLQKEKCITALQSVKLLTGLRGRWEILSAHPLTIADVAHNEAGINYSIRQLKHIPFQKLHIVLGFVQEKDLQKILHLFPVHAIYYFCRPDIPRGLDVEVLRTAAAGHHLKGSAYLSVPEAFEAAKANALPEDLIYVGGSTFVVAEVV